MMYDVEHVTFIEMTLHYNRVLYKSVKNEHLKFLEGHAYYKMCFER